MPRRPPPLLAYATPLSVVAGETVALHCSSPIPRVDVEVARIGRERRVVWRATAVEIGEQAIPDDVVARGCRWPAAVHVDVGADWRSGYYEVSLRAEEGGRALLGEAFFVVRPRRASADRPLLVLGSNTWNAYNDFGGANLYTGATHVSFERPMAPGFLSKPEGPGRRVAVVHPPDFRMVTHIGYHRLHHLSQWCGSAGWPNYEEPFVRWAEGEGYELDFALNADLELHPEILAGARLVLSVGHDEYWSARMRDAVEAHVAGGGNVAFFSGNTCFWQVRLEDGGSTMVGYKRAFASDPLYGTERQHLVTSMWSDPITGRPENSLTGVSFIRGGYARIGRRAPRGSGGYTVYRPEHWAFAGTELEYGDVLGGEAVVVGYECDGCELAFVDGRPVPTGSDGTPPEFTILATSPAAPFDRRTSVRPVPAGELSELEFHALRVLGDTSPASLEKLSYGNAVMGTYSRGGTVFTTGCTDWACGLDDPLVRRVTRNVLERLR